MTGLYVAAGAGIAAITAVIGVTALWHRIVDWHDAHTDRPGLIAVRREPVAAITARPHWEAVDELGPWNPSQHQTQPARLFHALDAEQNPPLVSPATDRDLTGVFPVVAVA